MQGVTRPCKTVGRSDLFSRKIQFNPVQSSSLTLIQFSAPSPVQHLASRQREGTKEGTKRNLDSSPNRLGQPPGPPMRMRIESAWASDPSAFFVSLCVCACTLEYSGYVHCLLCIVLYSLLPSMPRFLHRRLSMYHPVLSVLRLPKAVLP